MNPGSLPVAVIAGANGFIGRALSGLFSRDGYEVRLIGRSAPTRWDDPDALRRTIDGADILVNLAGKSVNCRYTDRNRDEILASRIVTTRALREAVGDVQAPPRVWMNASTATIYRHSTDRPNTESSGTIGSGFSVDVATAWEREFFQGTMTRTRRVALRMAIVLGADGPATTMLLAAARWGLGGAQHDGWTPPHRRYRGIGAHPTGTARAPWYRTRGHQMFSWVHIDDVLSAISFIRDDELLTGPINLAAPQPVDNRELMRLLRSTTRARFGLPTNRAMLEVGMWAMRSEPELLLKSRWVLPEKLTEAGFRFAHDDLGEALRSLGTHTPARRTRATTG